MTLMPQLGQSHRHQSLPTAFACWPTALNKKFAPALWPSCAVQDLQDVGCVGRVKYGVLLYGKVRQAKPTTRAGAALSYAMFILYWFATAEAMCTTIRLLTADLLCRRLLPSPSTSRWEAGVRRCVALLCGYS